MAEEINNLNGVISEQTKMIQYLKDEVESQKQGRATASQAASAQQSVRSRRRDLLVDKKGFQTLPTFTGKMDKYEDWNFTTKVYIETEPGFAEVLEWIEKQTEEPTKEMVT